MWCGVVWQHLEMLRGKVVAKEFHDQIMNKTKQPVGGGNAVRAELR